MNNIKVAKELVKLAKNLIALDEEGDGSGFQMMHEQENAEQERLDKAQKEGKKYILHHKEGNLWRIQACKDFGDIKKGDFGGLIKSEKNLSHEGNCWVFGGAWVYDNAQVQDDAYVYGDAQVNENASVFGNAQVYGNAKIYGNAWVYDFVQVQGNAQVYGNAKVYDNAVVDGYAVVCGKSKIHGEAEVDYYVKNQEITE